MSLTVLLEYIIELHYYIFTSACKKVTIGLFGREEFVISEPVHPDVIKVVGCVVTLMLLCVDLCIATHL